MPEPTAQPALTRLRTRRSFDGRADWPSAIAAIERARVLKASDAGVVLAGRVPAGGRVVVKARTLAGPRGALRVALGLTPMARAVRTSARLRELGIPTAAPLALLSGRLAGRRAEVFVLREIEGRTLLERLAERDLSPDAQRRAAKRIGTMIAQLARVGLASRDHKPSNIIVDDAGGVVLIDAELRVQRPVEAAARMLAALAIEPAGVGVELPRVATARVLRRVAEQIAGSVGGCSARALRDAAAAIIAAHGDPTPKDNPLVQSARGADALR